MMLAPLMKRGASGEQEMEELRAQLVGTSTGLGADSGAGGPRKSDLLDQLAATAVELRFVAGLLLRETMPLVELDRYWAARHRERFAVHSMLLAAVRREDLQARLADVRKELAEVRRAMGRCELLLAKIERVRRMGTDEDREMALREAQRFLDIHVLREPADEVSAVERVDRLCGLRDKNVVVPSARVEELREAMPLWQRLGHAQRSAVWLALGIGAFVCAQGLVPGRPGKKSQDTNDGESDSQASGPSQASVLRRVEGTTGRVADSWRAWAQEHIFRPTEAMIEQMFFSGASKTAQRKAEHQAAVLDARQSLSNMVDQHTESRGNTDATRQGPLDLSPISREYEQEIKAPLRGALRGNLVELMLIQAQAIKVEMLEAMMQIDQLMEENAFNAQLLVLAPALLVVGALYSASKSLYYALVDDSRSRASSLKQLRSLAVQLSAALARLREASVDGLLEEHEGLVAQLVHELRQRLHEYRSDGLAAVEEALEELQGRAGLDAEGRAQLCGQLVLMVCAE